MVYSREAWMSVSMTNRRTEGHGQSPGHFSFRGQGDRRNW